MLLQYLYNGLVTGSSFALLGVSFSLVLSMTGRMHVAYVASFALAPYVAIWLSRDVGAPMWLSVAVGVLCAIALGLLIEAFVYAPLSTKSAARRTDPLIPIFVAALGITIIFQNGIVLLFGASNLPLNVVSITGVRIGSIRATNFDLFFIGAAWVILLGLWVMLRYTRPGKQMRAIRENPVLARVVGMKPGRIRLLVMGIASVLAGLLGVAATIRGSASPTMGFNEVFDAFVVAFLAGVQRGPLLMGVVAMALGQVSNGLGGRLYSQQWSPLVLFSILLVFCVMKSLGTTRWWRIAIRPRFMTAGVAFANGRRQP